MQSQTVTLLSAGNSLGVYIPAKLLQLQLRKEGIQADIYMLEHLYDDETRENIPRYRKAFHDSFKVAKTGYKLARDSRSNLDEGKTAALLEQWRQEGRRKFLALTGFWIPVLERYQNMLGGTGVDIRLIRLDASDTPSFSVYGDACSQFANIWLYPHGEERIAQTITVSAKEPVSFEKRERRYLIHGGGWGIGTYKDKIAELESAGAALHIVTYYREGTQLAPHDRGQHRYYLLDPDWSPWHRNADGEFDFPPFAEIDASQPYEFGDSPDYPRVFELIRQSTGIISKPGGATLLDSLAAATPLIFLEPFGEHERSNARLWESLGLGICYEAWQAQHYSTDVLVQLHQNLLRARDEAGNLLHEIKKGR
ncbi:hypothetical protein ACFOQM_21160 [Paenibacillus sp. GCM10012307]|uniref:UDP-glucuronosyltransferase n=1 Tax=Paenibacillus roseus TaxID=2798579 RepID=A0A934JBF8_9BACL|nr:hypothetical protein [Paenibacillus roseus]MBJ6363740.1 hypothetical protein [Paenibacillus roseus]